MKNYHFNLFYGDADNGYSVDITHIFDLQNCSVFEASSEEALREGRIVKKSQLATIGNIYLKVTEAIYRPLIYQVV